MNKPSARIETLEFLTTDKHRWLLAYPLDLEMNTDSRLNLDFPLRPFALSSAFFAFQKTTQLLA